MEKSFNNKVYDHVEAEGNQPPGADHIDFGP